MFKTSEPGSALLTCLEDPQIHSSAPEFFGLASHEDGNCGTEPGLSAVRLWEKSLPFLLSFLGIYFVFLDFVFFAPLGSLFIVNKDKREVIPQKKPLLCFQSLDIRELTQKWFLLEISSK